jgi:hypothetical protein
VSLILPVAAQGKKRQSMIRVHAQANTHDTGAFASAVHAQLSGKDVAIEKIPRITENDVVAFKPYPHANGDFGALLQLDSHGQLSLDTLSIERRGEFVFLFVNGRAITEMQIDRRVSDGKIYIPAGLTAPDIDRMKKDWPLIGKKPR